MFGNGRKKIMKTMQAMDTEGWQVERQLTSDPKRQDLEWTVKKGNVLAVIRFNKQGKIKEILGNTISKFNGLEYYHPFNAGLKKSFQEMIEAK